ncbi:MAG TPA: TolC family protein [Thermoanaerobaculia bacterium]|nr:TolC family protein [Thermoanaerobaculia bacterium]
MSPQSQAKEIQMGIPKTPWMMALFAAAVPAVVGGAPPTKIADTSDPVLERLVEEALHENPDARSAAAEADAARFRIAPAGTLPDPFLSLNYQNDGRQFSLGTKEMTFLGATFSQPLPWPGKLRLAGEIAGGEAKQVESAVLGRSRRSVEARVRRAYAEWQLATALRNLAEERRSTWREIEGVVRARYSAGLAVQQDLLRAQAEILRLDEEAAVETANVAARLADLDRAVGRPQDMPVENARPLDLDPALPELSRLLESIRAGHPELAGAEAAIQTDKLRVDLTKKEFLPDFVASAGPMYRGGLDPMWQVGLGISLPIYSGSRQRNRLREAEANLQSGEARLASARQELEFRTRERYETLKGVLRAAQIDRDGVIPIDQLSLESAIASYRTGRVPFVTVLDALNALYSDRSNLYVRLADAGKLRVAIDEADLQTGPAMAPSVRPAASMSSNAASPAGSMR